MRRCLLIAAALGPLLAGCGSYSASVLEQTIRSRLDQHRGFRVESVQCPSHAKLRKGVVIRCTATLDSGHVVAVRATQLDGKGTVHVVAGEMFADNVEHGVVVTLAQHGIFANAACPQHVPVVIGRSFVCKVTGDGGRPSAATVTIVDRDGGFRLQFR